LIYNLKLQVINYLLEAQFYFSWNEQIWKKINNKC